MIFADKRSPLQTVIDKGEITFGEWVSDKLNILFLPKREPNYAISFILQVFMKRLRQSYREIMLMPEDVRDEIFKSEKELMDKEEEQTRGTKKY